jgi:hypothetical protein
MGRQRKLQNATWVRLAEFAFQFQKTSIDSQGIRTLGRRGYGLEVVDLPSGVFHRRQPG